MKNTTDNIVEYEKRIRELLGQQYWATDEFAFVLRCSIQRIHELSKIYNWRFMKTAPKMWESESLLRDIPVIFQRRLSSAYKHAITSEEDTQTIEEKMIERATLLINEYLEQTK